MFERANVNGIFFHVLLISMNMQLPEYTIYTHMFRIVTAIFFSLFQFVISDFCRDESDYSDGYVTDGLATMDVFEYEVDFSSDSEDLYSRGSSSGTDVCTLHMNTFESANFY